MAVFPALLIFFVSCQGKSPDSSGAQKTQDTQVTLEKAL
jgi:hypothetical protein